jgi:hypothetical protein
MSLPWVRLDSHYYANPKVLALSAAGKHRALHVYVCGLAYSGGTGSDGFIPREALILFGAKAPEAKTLVDAGLWTALPGGWTVNGWHDYQPTSGEHEARSKKAKEAAAKRWSKAELRAVKDA